ncbi:MAG: hypothetical protein FWC60_06545 [Firmicutes bacterium]|nr:hypothetical protein [Bacillota bacterium]
MKKKLLVVGLVAIIALLVSACGGKSATPTGGAPETSKSAYQLFSEASKTLQDAKSSSMDMDVKMDIDAAGQKETVGITGNVKQANFSTDKPEMEISMDMSMGGQTIQNIKAFYTDGYYYMDMMGQKVKMAMPVEDVLKQSNTAVLDLDESMIKDQKVDGKVLSFTLTKDAMAKLLGDNVSNMMAQLGSEKPPEFSDVIVTATLDDKNQISNINMKFSANMTVQGQSAKFVYDMTLKVVQVDNVTITLPTDLSAYQESKLKQ